MILIDEVKYSCIECIRGHRSLLCRHFTRPLLQVRQKGRPNITANGNPNHRIAVFAEQVDEGDRTVELCGMGCGYKPGVAKGSRAPPVVIIKALEKQVIDMELGKVLGPYEESSATNEDNENIPETTLEGRSNTKIPNLGLTDVKSLNTGLSCCKKTPETAPMKGGCCGSKKSKVLKTTSSCGCSHNKKKTINKLKILRTYLQKHNEKQTEKQTDTEVLAEFLRKVGPYLGQMYSDGDRQKKVQNGQYPQKFENKIHKDTNSLQFQNNFNLDNLNLGTFQNFNLGLHQIDLNQNVNQSQNVHLQLNQNVFSDLTNAQNMHIMNDLMPKKSESLDYLSNVNVPGLEGLLTGNNAKLPDIQTSRPEDFIHIKQETFEDGGTLIPGLYDVVSVPACSIPGSCCCDDDCSCEGCEVHKNGPQNSSNEGTQLFPPTDGHQSLPYSGRQTLATRQVQYDGPEWQPEANLANLGLFAAGPLKNVQNGSALDSPALVDSGSSAGAPTDQCLCLPWECECNNCETHGIINGLKLDHLFAEQPLANGEWSLEQVASFLGQLLGPER